MDLVWSAVFFAWVLVDTGKTIKIMPWMNDDNMNDKALVKAHVCDAMLPQIHQNDNIIRIGFVVGITDKNGAKKKIMFFCGKSQR